MLFLLYSWIVYCLFASCVLYSTGSGVKSVHVVLLYSWIV